MSFIRLSAGHASAVVAPDIGGSLLSFRCRDTEILRNADDDAVARSGPLGSALFPMVPWVSRIKNGRFSFGGRTAKLPLAPDLSPHSLHGLGWQNEWEVVSHQEAALRLAQSFSPPDWPWRASAEMTVSIEPGVLLIDLSLRNDDESPMPAALGFHPCFPRTPETRLELDAAGVWLMDGAGFPHEHAAAGWDRENALNGSAKLDALFTGWGQPARIVQRDHVAVLTASGPAKFLIVYAPPSGDFLCVEPATTMTDAVNRPEAADVTGLIALAPEETLTLAMRLEIETR